MLLLNYSHPLTDEQLAQTAALLGAQEVFRLMLNYSRPLAIDEQIASITDLLGAEPEVRRIAVQIDQAQPLVEQVRALADAAGLTPDEWQTTPLIINLPGFAPAAAALLAELHGRCGGRFPPFLRLRPVTGSTPTYEVAEIVRL